MKNGTGKSILLTLYELYYFFNNFEIISQSLLFLLLIYRASQKKESLYFFKKSTQKKISKININALIKLRTITLIKNSFKQT